ncbi:MAG TPA: bifunctional phosphoribosyl-AMP cyclohydrolase/phosphoribosyl-ATP diphosphatase HisIE [Pseudomonadota bacterium]|nr:bifunctional phosphoribosyl-AMP cyclohydrolase/phosphoribosyl-ATP diphosphatase HisIE [Xanthomonadales bacterium]HRA37268.1 bifunctional phosphoribosyl-AMP cyclohydrolase/phosphoribosyl-ATP diphosphatase HisIE [Pseudomonadota bacterium]
MQPHDLAALDFTKSGGLVPAIVQHADSGAVLMLGWMDEAALAQTRASGRVTFYSRSKARLWTKGETSGHWLEVVALHADCDNDTVLVRARPAGPTCHLGTATCFADAAIPPLAFLGELDALVASRARERPPESYTTRLFESGVGRIAQKLGEEGVEAALAAVSGSPAELCDEAADLVFHLLVLLQARGLDLAAVAAKLRERHEPRG